MLTQDKFTQFKSDYTILKPTTTTDRYGNKQNVYNTPRCVVHTFWHPLKDEADIAEYGEEISNMLSAVIYETDDIKNLDEVSIDGDMYEIVSIPKYATHRVLKVRKLKQ